MLDYLKEICNDGEVNGLITADIINIFVTFGFSTAAAKVNTEKLIKDLQMTSDINGFERAYRAFLFGQETGGNLPGIIKDISLKRAERIYSEIADYIFDVKEKVLDYGCGNGLVAQFLRKKDGIDVVGCDIKSYVEQNTNVPNIKIDEYKIDCEDNTFSVCYANSVLHHDEFPEKIIAEISRVVTKTFILIEDVIIGNSIAEQNTHKKRLFFSDYVYNRLIIGEQIPMPVTYKTSEKWIKLVSVAGWRLIKSDHLGQSKILPVIFRDRMIFSKNN